MADLQVGSWVYVCGSCLSSRPERQRLLLARSGVIVAKLEERSRYQQLLFLAL